MAASDIKLAHSVFAMPFAVLGLFLALPHPIGPWRIGGLLLLVALCMVLARTWAMLVNRLADRRFDADNPRTARRAIASGRLPARSGLLMAIAAGVGFQLAAAGFWVMDANIWPTLLAVPVLAWIALYSFTKRFTTWCHLFLGGALASSPLAAAVAVDPTALTITPALWAVAGMVLFWVAGFDVIYALQDIDFDRETGLRSIPARFGRHAAAWFSRAFHVIAFGLLVVAWRVDPRLGWVFAASLAPVAGLLIAEHVVLARRGLAGLDMAFFTLNGVVGCIIGIAGSIDTFI